MDPLVVVIKQKLLKKADKFEPKNKKFVAIC
jgi:hypothetical protein